MFNTPKNRLELACTVIDEMRISLNPFVHSGTSRQTSALHTTNLMGQSPTIKEHIVSTAMRSSLASPPWSKNTITITIHVQRQSESVNPCNCKARETVMVRAEWFLRVDTCGRLHQRIPTASQERVPVNLWGTRRPAKEAHNYLYALCDLIDRVPKDRNNLAKYV